MVSDAFVEATDAAANDTDESKPGRANVVSAENREVHEQFVGLVKAVQDTMASAPAHESDRDIVVYGLCVFVPQAGNPTQPQCDVSNMTMLLTARANDQHAMKMVEVADDKSAETRQALRDLLNAIQHALTSEPDGGALHEAMPNGSHDRAAGALGALPHHKLSEREFQVVHMLSKGQTVGAISKTLNLSVKTVSTYRVRALKKMNFKTNAELIRYMIQYKLG